MRRRIEQVIAPLFTFIIHRIANKSTLTTNAVPSERISEFKARTREELTGGSGAFPGGDPARSADERVVTSGEFGVGVKTPEMDFHQERI